MARRSTAQNNYLEVSAANGGSILNGLRSWTVGAWVYARSAMTTGNTAILTSVKPGANDIPIMIGVSNTDDGQTPGRWVAAFYDDSLADWDFAQDTISHEVGRWIHIVGQHEDGVALRLFKNGVFVSTGAVAGYGTTSQAFRVGHRWNSALSTDFFDGLIRRAFVYDGVLTRTEILDLYKGVSPLSIRQGKLKAYWPLDDVMPGGGAVDLSPTQAHLSMVGTVAYEPDNFTDDISLLRLPAALATLEDTATVYLDLQASSTELAEAVDSTTVPLLITPSGVDSLGTEYIDSATVVLDLQVSDVQVFEGIDSATVLVDLQASGIEHLGGPSNDDFANAIALSTTLPGLRSADTTVNASSETGEPIDWPAANDIHSVWYTFTPTTTGRYKFRLSNTDTVVWTDSRQFSIGVYSGSAVNALTLLKNHQIFSASSGPQGGDIASVAVNLTSGVTYRIRVANPFFTGEAYNDHAVQFDISWDQVTVPAAPANDNIANAENLGTDPVDGEYIGTLKGATVEGWESTGGYIGESVWYRFHCGGNETQELHVVSAGTNPDFRPYWEIYEITTDPPADFTDLNFVDSASLAADDDASGSVALVSGTDYVIYVSSWDWNGEWDDFSLIFGAYTPPSAPVNDVRTDLNSTPLFAYYPWYLGRSEWYSYPAATYWTNREAGQAAGTTELATADAGEPAHAGFGPTRSVWYVLDIAKAGDYKIWVESAVDCVLSLYNKPNGTLGTLIAEDDDSGAGNWPEITQTLGLGDYWIAIDSKTEGTFVLKWQKQPTGTPPSNDNLANATVISSVPYSSAGTTVDATAEPEEHDATELGAGPSDSVWYKYVAPGNGTLKIKATCDTNNVDAYVYIDTWRGTSFDNMVRDPDPPPTGPGGGINRGFFNHFDTAEELEAAAINLDVVSGQTYYIRVQTESGGSEDFTIYVEVAAIYLDLQASGSEEVHGTLLDEATIYLDLQHSGVEDFHPADAIDSATVLVDLIASGIEFKAFEYTETATVLLDLQAIQEHDCYFHLEPSFIADGVRKWAYNGSKRRWAADGKRRWAWTEGEGLPQIC